ARALPITLRKLAKGRCMPSDQARDGSLQPRDALDSVEPHGLQGAFEATAAGAAAPQSTRQTPVHASHQGDRRGAEPPSAAQRRAKEAKQSVRGACAEDCEQISSTTRPFMLKEESERAAEQDRRVAGC